MTPQSTFMVLAPIAAGREDELRALLATMNARAGMADPQNALVPFGRFDRLHFARFVIVEAPSADDIAAYGMPPSTWPPSLAFLGDCDGPADTFLADLARRAGDGLRRIFAHCGGLAPEDDLLLLDDAARPAVGGDLRQLDRPHRAADPRGAGPPPGAGRPPAGRRRTPRAVTSRWRSATGWSTSWRRSGRPAGSP